MTCYKMVLKKSHKEVLTVIDKVLMKKQTPESAAKELGISDSAFKELYADVTAKMILV